MAKNDGGSAFPFHFEQKVPPADAIPGKLYAMETQTCVVKGMSLRDYFAAVALPITATQTFEALRRGELACKPGDGGHVVEAIATGAYELADAMLKARDA